MRTLLTMVVVILLACGGAWGKTPYLSEQQLQEEVRRGMDEILDFWRDGRYGELYDRTALAGKQTREQFGKVMAAASVRPACCWEKLQEVKVSLKGDSVAMVRAKLGFEKYGGEIAYKTRGFRLVKEDGVWRMTQSDLLALAESRQKKPGKGSRSSR